MAPRVKVLREGALHRIPQQHDQLRLWKHVANPMWSPGMEQVVGGDVSAALARPGIAVMGRVPVQRFLVVQGKVVHLLAGRQEDLRMEAEKLLQAGRAPLLGAQAEKVRQGTLRPEL